MGKQYLKKDAVKRVFRCTGYKKMIAPTKQLPPPLYEETDKFCKSELIFSPRAHKFYKQRAKNKKVMSKKKLFFLMRECLLVIRKKIVHNESGVFIKNFGYFCMVRHPERRIKRFRIKGCFITGRYINTVGCQYSPVFLPIRKDSAMQQWTMDRAFSKKLTSSMKYYMEKDNRRYRMSFAILNNLYGRENLKIEPPIKK